MYNNLKSKYENYRRSCERVIDVTEDDKELNSALTFDDMTTYDNEVERLLVQLVIFTFSHYFLPFLAPQSDPM